MDLSTKEGKKQQGGLIRRAAREAGMTADELAQRIGCSRSLIYQYLSGVSLVQTDRLQQIAAEVGKPLEWFFRDDPDALPGAAQEARRLREERDRIARDRQALEEERSRLDSRRISDSESHQRELIAAWSSPPDWRRVAAGCQKLAALLDSLGREADLAECLLTQGNALVQLHEWGAARESLDRAGSLFRQRELPDRALACLQSLGQVNVMLGRAEEALRQFEEVSLGESWWNRWQGALSVGAAHEALGDYARAGEAFARAMEIIEESEPGEDRDFGELYVQANWANVDLDTGELAGAADRAAACIHLSQRHGVQDQYIEALLTRGAAFLHLRRFAEARSDLQQALDVAQLTRDYQRWSMALSSLSLWKSACQQPAEAIALGKEGLALALRYGATRAEILGQRAVAAAYLAAGNSAEALYHARQGLEQASGGRLTLLQGQLGVLEGWALIEAGKPAEAARSAGEAVRRAESLGAVPLSMEAHLLLSVAAGQVGDARQAAIHADAAAAAAERLVPAEPGWQIAWARALASRIEGDLTAAESYFKGAVASLARERAAVMEASGEDALMEGANALSLWREWLGYLLSATGVQAAEKAAAEARWPPLEVWLESQIATPTARRKDSAKR